MYVRAGMLIYQEFYGRFRLALIRLKKVLVAFNNPLSLPAVLLLSDNQIVTETLKFVT